MLNKITLCVGSQYKSSSGAEQKKTDIFFHSALEEGLFCKPKYRAILFKSPLFRFI